MTKNTGKSILRALVISVGLAGLSACGGSSDDSSTSNTNTSNDNSSGTVAAATYTDVSYATASSTEKLDLYVPAGNGPFPLVINIHGGAFKMGTKAMLDSSVKDTLLAAGYAVASINYRLSSEAIFPAALLDAKAAVRYLRANAATYRLDGTRFAAFGQSSGGNIASMLGASGDIARFDDATLGYPGVSSRVQAVIDWFGPTDFLQMDTEAAAQGCSASDQTHNLADSPESLYLGAAIQSVPSLAAESNPINYLSSDDPAWLVQKGSIDCTVPVAQSQLLVDALNAKGLKVTYTLIEGAGHGDMALPGQTTAASASFTSAANLQIFMNFLNTHLK